jgi:hypothetical protein
VSASPTPPHFVSGKKSLETWKLKVDYFLQFTNFSGYKSVYFRSDATRQNLLSDLNGPLNLNQREIKQNYVGRSKNLVLCLYLSFSNTQTMHVESKSHNSNAMFFLKNLYSCKIWTRVCCFWGYVMSTTPRRQGDKINVSIQVKKHCWKNLPFLQTLNQLYLGGEKNWRCWLKTKLNYAKIIWS